MSDLERNLGEQPLTALLARLELKPADLVAASTEQLNHKMVTRGCKGRRLTPNVQAKILRAVQRASGQTFELGDLFDYRPPSLRERGGPGHAAGPTTASDEAPAGADPADANPTDEAHPGGPAGDAPAD